MKKRHILAIGLVFLAEFAFFSSPANAKAGDSIDCDSPSQAQNPFCQCMLNKAAAAHIIKENATEDQLKPIVMACIEQSFADAGAKLVVSPDLSFSPPVQTQDGSWVFTWQVPNYPKNTTIQFFAGSDPNSNNGFMISKNIPVTSPGSFTWTGEGVTPGKYYIFAELGGDGVMPGKAVYVSKEALETKYATDISMTIGGSPGVVAGGSFQLNFTIANTSPHDLTSSDIWMQLSDGIMPVAGQIGLMKYGAIWKVFLPTIQAGQTVTIPVNFSADASAAGQHKTINSVIETGNVYNANKTKTQAELSIMVSPK